MKIGSKPFKEIWREKRVRFCILPLASAIVGFSILSQILYPYLIDYLDESSRYWIFKKKQPYKKQNYSLGIFGDSQWISGLDLSELEKSSGVPQEEILVYALPSMQPEGIELTLGEILEAGVQFETVWINLSPTSTIQNTVFETYLRLESQFGNNTFRIFKNSRLRKMYFKNSTELMHAIASQIFPLIKINSGISSTTRLLPIREEDWAQSKDLETRLGPSTWGLLRKRKNENLKMLSEFGDQGIWTWKGYDTQGCRKEPLLDLDPNLKLSFSRERKDWKESLVGIENLVQSKFVVFWIPYSDPMEEITELFGEIWERESDLAQNRSTTRSKFIRIPREIFQNADFQDYTHFNKCGATKLSRWLGTYYRTNL
jgi:hypothetical protein